jgi:hypothetical protein
MDDILKQLAAADPYRAIESEDLPSSRFYASTFDTIVGLDPDLETGTISVARHSKLRSRVPMNRRYKWGLLTPTVVAGLVGLSFGGAAIADAVSSQSPVSKFLQTEAAQPRLTSRAMLDRGGVHRLSAHVGRIARADDVTVTTTLGDGTVLAPPAPTATAAISQGQAWSAFVAYGRPPNIYVLASTPAPTIELAQISKANPPDGGSLNDTLVWVIHYQDIAVYDALENALHNQYASTHPGVATGLPTQLNPSQEIGYFDVFVDANTGQVLYTTAHATYG